jgi:hypothetical protein
MNHHVGPWTVRVPAEWLDITDTLDEADPPFTLAKETGVGALQFSSAEYLSGERPAATAAELAVMVREFGEARAFGKMFDGRTSDARPAVASGSFRVDGNLIRVWYVSERGSFLLVTYVCDWQDRNDEADDAEAIVGRIRLERSRS